MVVKITEGHAVRRFKSTDSVFAHRGAPLALHHSAGRQWQPKSVDAVDRANVVRPHMAGQRTG